MFKCLMSSVSAVSQVVKITKKHVCPNFSLVVYIQFDSEGFVGLKKLTVVWQFFSPHYCWRLKEVDFVLLRKSIKRCDATPRV